jgi:hypothetical protein
MQPASGPCLRAYAFAAITIKGGTITEMRLLAHQGPDAQVAVAAAANKLAHAEYRTKLGGEAGLLLLGASDGVSAPSMTAGASPEMPPPLPGAWCLVAEVSTPPSRGADADAADVPVIFGVCVLAGQRVRYASRLLAHQAALYSREVALRPPPRRAEDVVPPTASVTGALAQLCGGPAPTPAILIDATVGIEAASMIASRLPHADMPLERIITAFSYAQLHTLVSLISQGQFSIAVIASSPSAASEVTAAALGLIYPLRWHGAVQLAAFTAEDALEALNTARRENRPVILSTTPAAVPALLCDAARHGSATEGALNLWLADCSTGLVAPACPAAPSATIRHGAAALVELLPHEHDLKSRWSKARAELESGSGSYGGGLVPTGPQLSRETLVAVLTGAMDGSVELLSAFRTYSVPADQTVSLHVLLARQLNLTAGDPSLQPGGALLASLLRSPLLLQWSRDVIPADRAAASAKGSIAHWLYPWLLRCGERYPESFPEYASTATRKAASSAFGAFTSLVKHAKNSVRASYSSMPTVAPATLPFQRLRGVPDARGRAAAMANACSTMPASDVANCMALIIRTAPRAAVEASRPHGLRHLPDAMPNLERVLTAHYAVNDHCLVTGGTPVPGPAMTAQSAAPYNFSRPPVSMAATARVPVDLLDSFAEYHLLIGPALDGAHSNAFRTAVAHRFAPSHGFDLVPSGDYTVENTSGLGAQSSGKSRGFQFASTASAAKFAAGEASTRLRSVLSLSHMLPTSGSGTHHATADPPRPGLPRAAGQPKVGRQVRHSAAGGAKVDGLCHNQSAAADVHAAAAAAAATVAALAAGRLAAGSAGVLQALRPRDGGRALQVGVPERVLPARV